MKVSALHLNVLLFVINTVPEQMDYMAVTSCFVFRRFWEFSLNAYVYRFIVNTVVQWLSCVWLSATPWIAAHQASLSFTISQSLLKFMFIELVMLSNHLILYCALLLLPSVCPSIRVFSSESALCIRWPKSGASASASVLPMDIRVYFLWHWLVWSPCSPRGSQESSPEVMLMMKSEGCIGETWTSRSPAWKEENVALRDPGGLQGGRGRDEQEPGHVGLWGPRGTRGCHWAGLWWLTVCVNWTASRGTWGAGEVISRGFCEGVFLEEISLWTGGPDKANHLPQSGWVLSNPLRAWVGQKGWREGEFSLLDCWAGIRVSFRPQVGTYTTGFSGL